MWKICLTVALIIGAGTALADGPKELEPKAAKALIDAAKVQAFDANTKRVRRMFGLIEAAKLVIKR
jgi:hypothetical protein